MKRWFLSLLPVSLCSLWCLTACGSTGGASGQRDVTPQAARASMARGEVAVIDVRTAEEFAAGHLEGATLVSVASDGFVAKVRAAAAGKPVLVYCQSGNRSAKAARQLSSAGERDVRNLWGGITAWQSAGNKVVK
jgi:rhodanese-related sulfurtransferase